MTESGAQRLQRGAPAGGEGRRRALWRRQQQQQEPPSPRPPLPPPPARRAQRGPHRRDRPRCRRLPANTPSPPPGPKAAVSGGAGCGPCGGRAAPLKLPEGVWGGGEGRCGPPPTPRARAARHRAGAASPLPAPLRLPACGITGRAGGLPAHRRACGSVRGRDGAALRSAPLRSPPPPSSRRPAGLAAAAEAARPPPGAPGLGAGGPGGHRLALAGRCLAGRRGWGRRFPRVCVLPASPREKWRAQVRPSTSRRAGGDGGDRDKPERGGTRCPRARTL